MKIPFKRETFSQEMKPKISGNNLSLEYDNLESTLFTVGINVSKIINLAQYESLCDVYAGSESVSAKNATAIDYLQRAILHFCLYEHTIFLIARIGNDGITVKKNDDETTIFRYQQDELNNKLISLGWFWMNQLISFLNSNVDDFTSWKASNEKKEFDSLPVSTADFQKWVGISGGDSFTMSVRWIITEVWNESVLSRIKEPSMPNDKILRAVCYEVIGRACQRLDYYCLPEPLRKSVDDASRSGDKSETMREKIASIYLDKASQFWTALDISLKRSDMTTNGATSASRPVFRAPKICSDDSFVY